MFFDAFPTTLVLNGRSPMKMKWLVLSVMVFGLYASRGLFGPHHASAQPGDPIPKHACFTNTDAECPECPNSYEFECTTQIPVGWEIGDCWPVLTGDCSEWIAFDCGQTVNCILGIPGRNACGLFWLCN
jgi:hypothetical protein